jgi:hypothetical protein
MNEEEIVQERTKILDTELYPELHITAQEVDTDIYLGDGVWGKPEYYEH